jgi:hypothetical protein
VGETEESGLDFVRRRKWFEGAAGWVWLGGLGEYKRLREETGSVMMCALVV